MLTILDLYDDSIKKSINAGIYNIYSLNLYEWIPFIQGVTLILRKLEHHLYYMACVLTSSPPTFRPTKFMAFEMPIAKNSFYIRLL